MNTRENQTLFFRKTKNPDILIAAASLLNPGPFLYVVGFVFLLLSCFLFYDGRQLLCFTMAIPGLIFTGIGAYLTAQRKYRMIDRKKRKIIHCDSRFGPFARKVYRIKPDDILRIDQETRVSDDYSQTVFLLRIPVENDTGFIHLETHDNYYRAIEAAGLIAPFLDIPFLDAASGEQTVREVVPSNDSGGGPGDLDMIDEDEESEDSDPSLEEAGEIIRIIEKNSDTFDVIRTAESEEENGNYQDEPIRIMDEPLKEEEKKTFSQELEELLEDEIVLLSARSAPDDIAERDETREKELEDADVVQLSESEKTSPEDLDETFDHFIVEEDAKGNEALSSDEITADQPEASVTDTDETAILLAKTVLDVAEFNEEHSEEGSASEKKSEKDH